VAALLIIIASLAAIAVGRVPRLRINRAGIALVGATALVGIGALSLDEAYEAIDLDTIALLLGMMVVNANLRAAGFFAIVARRAAQASSPARLLLGLMLSTGFLSALFMNDTIVLVFTPLVLEIVISLGLRPMPYLMGLALAANVGSVATITGNPQNMIIGVASGISFTSFAVQMVPLALICLLASWCVVMLVYRKTLSAPIEGPPVLPPIRVHRPLLRKCLVTIVVLLILLFAGVDIPLAALIAASILLVTRRVRPERVFREVDWGLLVFFAGLFVITGAIEVTGWGGHLFAAVEGLMLTGVPGFSVAAALLSNLVSNVPAVLLFRPYMAAFPDPETAWLVLSMATTFAGNLTLLGSVANLIVAESARGRGVELTFAEYLKAGIPTTLLTLAIGIAWFVVLG
jgi:Na+/H+ antiporter NhaD/arsenite permease-like protein